MISNWGIEVAEQAYEEYMNEMELMLREQILQTYLNPVITKEQIWRVLELDDPKEEEPEEETMTGKVLRAPDGTYYIKPEPHEPPGQRRNAEAFTVHLHEWVDDVTSPRQQICDICGAARILAPHEHKWESILDDPDDHGKRHIIERCKGCKELRETYIVHGN